MVVRASSSEEMLKSSVVDVEKSETGQSASDQSRLVEKLDCLKLAEAGGDAEVAAMR